MPESIDATAWSSLLLGCAALFAGIGALRRPGMWQTMIGEIDRSPALQLLSGFVELIAGTMLYLANPWIPADLLTCILKAIGGLMVFEALAILAIGDIYPHFWLRTLAHMSKGWPLLTALVGAGLTLAGMFRFG